MKALKFLGALVLATIFAAGAAHAAEIAYGDAIATVGENIKPTIETALTAVILAVVVKYAGPFGMFIKNDYVSALVAKAVDYAFGATFGAVRGKTLDVSQVDGVLGNVVRYAEGHFPWVLRYLIGGSTKLIEKAIARMVAELPAEYRYSAAPPPAK